MKKLSSRAALLLAFSLFACGKGPESGESLSYSPPAAEEQEPPVAEDPSENNPPPAQPKPPGKGRNYAAAVWSQVEGSSKWTDAVMDLMGKLLPKLELAKDKEVFCPGYRKATQRQKEICWLRIVGGVARFESSFNPSESFKEPDGHYSIGLMALSPGECPNAETIALLKIGSRNVACGIAKMANLIARDGWIEGPVGTRGAAAYWSVLRKPYVAHGYKLGKKHLIVPITSKFRQYD